MANTFIHETAIVDEGAIVGDGTKIWHFVHVMPGATLGKDCVLGQNVFIAPRVQVGNNVRIQNNVSLFTGVVLEDQVFVGPSAVFTNVINPRSEVNRKDSFLPTNVRLGASIGANATIVCGVEIGKYAFVGAGTVVTKNVPAYALIVGNPGRQIGWMSQAGERLHFDENGKSTCPGDGSEYVLDAGLVLKC